MQFFNFGSHGNYCLFRWLTERSGIDLDAMIALAFDKAEKNADYQVFESVPTAVREELANLLAETIEERLLEYAGLNGPDLDGCHVDDALNAEDPFLAVLVLAVAMVEFDFKNMAEALLIRAHKWAPDWGPHLPIPEPRPLDLDSNLGTDEEDSDP